MDGTLESNLNMGSISPMSQSSSTVRRASSTILIEKDGKTVSKTSTGKRKFHNKSKNGCDTCKRRRVKCDEGKPECKKCSNMGIECTYSITSNGSTRSSFDGNSQQIDARHRNSTSTSPPVKKRKSSSTQVKAEKDQDQQNQMLNPLAQLLAAAPKGIEQEIARFGGLSGLSNLPGGLGSLASLGGLVGLGGLGSKGSADLINAVKAQFLGQSQDQPAQNPGQYGLSTFPAITVKSPTMDSATPFGFSRDYSNSDNMGNPTNGIANMNNLSINMDLANNPTISPQPTMSPGSTHSPISIHQQPAPMASAHDFNAQLNSMASNSMSYTPSATGLNLVDLKLMYHYTTTVAPTITTAGISEKKIWMDDIPQLAFQYSFLMHSILAFSATHLSRTERNMEKYVTYHRGEALSLLREAVLEISPENTDALVASALILIMDSLANASLPSSSSATSLPASAWIFHVKGAATILTAVWPLPQTSRFYTFISVDLSDLGDIINDKDGQIADLVCFDESISDLYPVEYDSPYLITLAYLDKLHKEKYKSDFILRVFAFPALLDKTFLALLMSGDLSAMRIMRSYYSLLRGFTTEMKDKVWFLEGVSNVLPADVDDYTGGGGMHMMLDFLGGGLPSMATSSMDSGLNIDISDHFMNP